MHARASAKFASIVDSFKSKVEVTRGNLVVPGNSIMGLLTLAAEQGSIISIQITGQDEKELEEKLINLVNSFFGEGSSSNLTGRYWFLTFIIVKSNFIFSS